uniref:RPN1 N-terminal domain-containing protein n=1 Tax=Brassica campestris TaxID=3711 RepID=M4CVR5_BRACM
MASGPDPNSFGDGAKRDEATTKVPSKDPKKKDDKKEEDLSEEDLKLKQNLELYVEGVQDPNPELHKAALESMRQEIRASTSSMTLLDRMPKRLSWLELGALEEAGKLSITINKGGKFTVSQLFVDIQDFSNLEKLKVAWGGINEHNKAESTSGAVKEFIRSMTRLPPNSPVTDPKPHKAPKKVAVPSHLPEKLMKLDLQCFPDAELPSLLEPGKLRMLEKLYIKGGTKLTGFGKSVPEKPTECSVKVLRLKFLPRLKVEWRELRELYFPKLEFLDKYQSPQVSFCPCDGIGIWRGKSNQL